MGSRSGFEKRNLVNREPAVLDIAKATLITGSGLVLIILIWLAIGHVILGRMAQFTGEIFDVRHRFQLLSGRQDLFVFLAHQIMLSGLFGMSHRLVEFPQKVSAIAEAEVLPAVWLRKKLLFRALESLQCIPLSPPIARISRALELDSDHSQHIPRPSTWLFWHRQRPGFPGAKKQNRMEFSPRLLWWLKPIGTLMGSLRHGRQSERPRVRAYFPSRHRLFLLDARG